MSRIPLSSAPPPDSPQIELTLQQRRLSMAVTSLSARFRVGQSTFRTAARRCPARVPIHVPSGRVRMLRESRRHQPERRLLPARLLHTG